ncbi:hypothetical protein JGU66_02620 [Myxococcaceae bacterium JPH2]|nr:hypothetical protein [Myxococcaceae bacterium JPH2]
MSRHIPASTRALWALAVSSVLSVGCEAPSVVPTADHQQNTRAARIEGTLVAQTRARGNAIVFIYDADRPPPPVGTGRPKAFTVIPAVELFGQALGDPSATGPFTAPFTLSLVYPGRYLLRGFIDADTCRTGAQPCHSSDFIPWYGVTGEPNMGDVGGAAVDLATGASRILEVTEDADGWPQPLTGVAVSFSDTATVPLDRPAFQVAVGTRTLDAKSGTKFLKLRPQVISQGGVEQRPPGFLVQYVDDNKDGVPDDANRDNVGDLWPKVVVRKLAGTVGVLDENDLDHNGIPDAEGVDYVHTDGMRDGQPDVVVLAAGLVPDPLITALTDESGAPRMKPIIVPELDIAIRPIALDARNPAAPAPLATLPSGRYSITLITSTGQTWRVPNELDPALAPTLGLPSVETQSFTIEVP